PLMTKSSYFHSFTITGEREVHPKQVISGYTCMEHDRLFEEKDGLILQVGDQIKYDKVGAYTMCLTPLFIKYFPDVYVEENGAYSRVRKAWKPEQYVQLSEID